jgi:hypothetical protein
MQPVGTCREREGVGQCVFVAGRIAGRGGAAVAFAQVDAPDEALPVPGRRAKGGRLS